ncbi:hypothetical protein P8452_65829 [Trifolium repens]|nr:hypothetical protein P8452_65829 [Trifolium repens]
MQNKKGTIQRKSIQNPEKKDTSSTCHSRANYLTISPRIRATSWISRFLAALYTVPPFGGVRRRYIWLGKRFDKYAILGDDICIADSKVAEVYLSTLKDLGVTISLPKSLVSDVGGAKFAKKFRLLGKLNHTKSSTVLRLKAIWLKAKLPFELWLGQCCPVDPYLKGRLIWKLQQAFRPKDLVVPPTSTYKSETFEYLEDMTLLRSWTEAWLKYVRWYYATALSPDVSIEDFFQAPVVTTRSFQRGVRTSLMLRLRLIENCCGETIAEAGLDPKPLTILARENPRPVEVDPAVVVDPVH